MRRRTFELQPLSGSDIQCYLDNGVQIYHIIEAIVQQIGRCVLINATFSVAEEFCRAIYRLKRSGLISYAVEIADIKATLKTVRVNAFMRAVFDEVYLSSNHAKFVLLANDRYQVAVVTSQNQTRGNRYEVGVISTSPIVYEYLYRQASTLMREESMMIDNNGTTTQISAPAVGGGVHAGRPRPSGGDGGCAHAPLGHRHADRRER